MNYLAYVLYSPLFLAGPIITFNYYISQVLTSCNFMLIIATLPFNHNIYTKNCIIRHSILVFRNDHGNNLTLHVRRRNLQITRLGRLLTLPIKYDKLLQSSNHMAQSFTPTLPH